MTARILPFPDFFRPASPRDGEEPCLILILPIVRVEREEVECPKVQELRRQSKMLREHFKRNPVANCIGVVTSSEAAKRQIAVDHCSRAMVGLSVTRTSSPLQCNPQFSGGTCSGGENG